MSTAMPVHPGAGRERWGGGAPRARWMQHDGYGDTQKLWMGTDPSWLSGWSFGVLWAGGAIHRQQLPARPSGSAGLRHAAPCRATVSYATPRRGSAAPLCRGAESVAPLPPLPVP